MTAPPGWTPPAVLPRVLRHRDFALLWAGMSISLLGDGVLLVALAWHVYATGGSPSAMAAVGVALTAPQLALLLAGGLVADRLPRRSVLLASDLVRCAAVLGMTAVAASGSTTDWHLWVCAATYGAATGFFGPAFDAVVPDLVPPGELTEANALDQVVRPLALRIAGPAVGGILVASVGAASAFALDAATFAVSLGCVAAIRYRGAGAPAVGGLRQELLGGLRYVAANSWLWATFASAAIAYLLFIGPTEVLLPYLVKNDLHGDARDLGIVLASGGLGAVLAAVTVAVRGIPGRFIAFIYATWAVGTLAVAGYGLATRTWQLAVVCAAVNALEAAGAVAWGTTRHRLVPPELQGRVSSLDWFISLALVPASYALTAPVAAALGARTTLIGAGVLGAAVTWLFLYVPRVRDPEQPAAASSSPVKAAG